MQFLAVNVKVFETRDNEQENGLTLDHSRLARIGVVVFGRPISQLMPNMVV
jgi:hypothetical protein